MKGQLDQLAAQGIYLGTSSWKYEGWLGQLYDEQRYLYRGKLATTRFERLCLEEYAEVFSSVCVDASYYRFPTSKFLDTIHDQVSDSFRFSHKVTDTITIKHFPRLKRHGEFSGQDNPHFLNADLFLSSFLDPLRPHHAKTGLLIFEFSRFYPGQFERGRDFLDQLDRFLSQLPTADWDFGVELRNESLLRPEYFEVLARHHVAHVYNQWTRMPDLADQLTDFPAKTPDAPVGARLLLKKGRSYEEAVQDFSPYRETRESQPAVREAATKLIRQRQAAAPGRKSYVYANNRLEGNALNTISAILNLLGTE